MKWFSSCVVHVLEIVCPSTCSILEICDLGGGGCAIKVQQLSTPNYNIDLVRGSVAVSLTLR